MYFFALSSDWFTALFASVVISLRDYVAFTFYETQFEYGLTKLKPSLICTSSFQENTSKFRLSLYLILTKDDC